MSGICKKLNVCENIEIFEGFKAFERYGESVKKGGNDGENRNPNVLPGAAAAAESNTQLLTVKYR